MDNLAVVYAICTLLALMGFPLLAVCSYLWLEGVR